MYISNFVNSFVDQLVGELVFFAGDVMIFDPGTRSRTAVGTGLRFFKLGF
ncbi:MAG: hypothetical protein HY396_00120 [Candidatus Doudnabacteria bacterium]|nr:hypothetical protein [Candidatus Doudnabacteria bacterium]